MNKKSVNLYEKLCKLASDEHWCWKLVCTTCGHMHFRYAFVELAERKSPTDSNWIIHGHNTQYSDILGPFPRSYTEHQKKCVIEICSTANLSNIAKACKYPDWLGYLGLILEHMHSNTESYSNLSKSWASQLKGIVNEDSSLSKRLS